MDLIATDFLYGDITDQIIKSFYKVYNSLGYGFLEKVYENAMKIELENIGYHIETQKPLEVFYEKKLVGLYFADMIVERKVIIENKAANALLDTNEDQILNYLKATEIEVGLLLNFGKKPEFKRKIFENKYKQIR
jgi:GxxExxY protein